MIRPYFVVCGGSGAGKTSLSRRLPGRGVELPSERYAVELVTTATGASVALLVVDATRDAPTQITRERKLLALFGISEVVLAVNKMDQLGFAEQAFRALTTDDALAIPVSALGGDNVDERSSNTPWYAGPTLREQLDAIAARSAPEPKPLRLFVNAPGRGTLVSGALQRGDRVRLLPSGRESSVTRIANDAGDVEVASAGDSVFFTLADSIETTEGMMLVAKEAPATVADQLQATLLWLHGEPMFPGRSYLIEIGAQALAGSVTALRHKLDLEGSARLPARRLDAGEVGSCNLSLERPAVFDPFHENRATGGFVLKDEATGASVGVGLLHFALRRAHNIHRQAVDVDQRARAEMKQQRPCVLWFTGLSASGKSTIANLVEKRLYALGRHTYLLDGDNVRHGLNRDLGFTDADRVENIRRVAEVAKLMVDAGLIVLVSFISPFRAERRMARELMGPGEFLEVFVDAPLAEAERRDPKGLYRKARRGELKHFTGIDSPYEAPENPELYLDTVRLSPEEAAELVLEQVASS